MNDAEPSDLRLAFPEKFLWGVSTSAYQIEGNNRWSDLWEWEEKKGWEPSGACANSWEAWKEDIRCIKELGVNAYRFSIEWARIEPNSGQIDFTALNKYEHFIDALLREGILPVVCLHHFTNPAWLIQKKGDWENPSAVDHFLQYVEILAQRFKDKVFHWITFNEPMVYLLHAYASGHLPPGKKTFLTSLRRHLMPAMQNIFQAHQKAYEILHAEIPKTKVSLSQHLCAMQPATESSKDIAATKRWESFFNWDFLDRAQQTNTLDFIGVNYYTRMFVRHFPGILRPLNLIPFFSEIRQIIGPLAFRLLGGKMGPGEKDDVGHEIYPAGIRQVVQQAWQRYKKPIWITENGLADTEGEKRARFILEHLRELNAAIHSGVPIQAYLHWSLLDNYEWGSYKPRFGLYRVDYQDNFRRTLTPGGQAFREIIQQSEFAHKATTTENYPK